jgi:hypothetical protein
MLLGKDSKMHMRLGEAGGDMELKLLLHPELNLVTPDIKVMEGFFKAATVYTNGKVFVTIQSCWNALPPQNGKFGSR